MKPEYFTCQCNSPEHTLRFVLDKEDNEIYTEVYLNQHNNFFKRCWIALKYVFGYTSKYGHWDCFILKNEEAGRLKHLLNKLKEPKNVSMSNKR